MICKPFEINSEADDFCDDRLEVVAKDKRQERRFVGENPKKSRKICKFRVDGSIMKEGKKCDYLVLSCKKDRGETDKKAYFIELKGTSLDDACQQISTSIDYLKHKLKGFDLLARIILTNAHQAKFRPTSFDKLLRKLGKEEKLRYRSTIIRENLETGIIQ